MLPSSERTGPAVGLVAPAGEPYALLYRSRAARPLLPSDLDDILASAQATNATLGVTGLLLYDTLPVTDGPPGRFVQWLEGPEAAVRPLYAAIRRDARHADVETVAQGPIRMLRGAGRRLFPDWAMALRRPRALPTTLPEFLAHFDRPERARP